MENHPTSAPYDSEDEQIGNAERLKLILDATHHGTYDWNIASGNVIFSPSCYTLLGYQPNEFPQIISAWHALIHPVDQERHQTALNQHLETGGDYAVEMRLQTKAGGWRWLLSAGRVVERTADGRPIRMVGVLTDINPRKLLEERLQKEIERGKRLLELYEHAPQLTHQELYNYVLGQAVALTESKIGFFHLVSADQAYIDLTTWNQAALNNCMVPRESHYAIDQAGNWVDCIREKRPIIYNEYTASPNQKGLPEGHTPITRFMSIPVMEGELVRVIFGVGNKEEAYDEQDIIQIQLVANELQKIIRQRHADDALRENEHLLADAQQIGHLGSWVNNLAADQLQWSDETYRIFQIPIGTPVTFLDFLKYIHPDDQDLMQKIHQNVQAGIAPPDIEHRILLVNGEVRYVFRRSQIEFDSAGKPVKLKGSIQDITERKRVDMEIQSFNQELERRVTERTAQLETANRELESFAYTISHDLRAPLRHIHGFVELLSEESSFFMNETTREYMKIISASTKQMGTLIDDLLAFTHLGRKEMVKTRVDMNELVRDAVRELAPEAAGRSILWQIGDLPDVTGDRAMLQLAMVNLISNAIKFTRPHPEAKIEIGSYPEALSGAQVFFVRDNGVGFDMQYAGKLFGVFQRLLRTTEFEGNGIGLANARRIIQRHDGKIWAEAQPDQGAAFFFTLG